MKIVFWNSKSIRNKIIEFINFLSNNNIDICLLTETWLSEKDKFYHPHYKCIRRDRINKTGGGVAILIKNTIGFETIPSIVTQVIENVGIEIRFRQDQSLQIYAAYFPGGQNDSTLRNKYRSDLRKMLNRNGKFLICGDLNSRHRNWNCLRANLWGNILCDLTSYFPVTISFPNTPTFIPSSARFNPSTLDLILSNMPEFISNPITLNELCSDHLPVSFNLSTSMPLFEKLYYNFNRADWQKYRSMIGNKLQNDTIENFSFGTRDDVDDHVDCFTNLLLDAVRQSVPKSKPRTNYLKLPDYILRLIKIRNQYRREWSRYRQHCDYEVMNRYTVLVRNEIFLYRNKQWNNRLSSLEKGAKPFWNTTKVLKRKTGHCHSLVSGDEVLVSDIDKANAFAETFVNNHSVSENLGSQQFTMIVNQVIECFDSSDFVTPNSEIVSISDIEFLIGNCKKRKACGLDEVNNQMLKNLPQIAIRYLTKIFNSCLSLQYFPDTWKTAKVVPIPKPGKMHNRTDGYRPISLLSSLGKILEKILSEKLLKYICENQILPDEQFGFRKSHSTIHQVKRICNDVKQGLSSGLSTALVLLDVEKAFDSVWHFGLIYKLIQFSFPMFLVKLIRNFLKDRYFCVAVGDSFSDLHEIPAGVPQGSVLGPLLYNIFCSDMPAIAPCKFAAYADDLAIYFTHEFSQDILTELQCSIDKLEDYYFRWKISINSNKTQAIFFTRKRKLCYLPTCNLTISGSSIAWSDNIKYLGICLDSKLTFKSHVDHTIEKINKYKRILFPLINRNSLLSNDNKMLIVRVIFQAIIFYGCPIWGSCAESHLKRLQIAQNKLLKMVLKLPWHFSTSRLHIISDTKTVSQGIEQITTRFISNCNISENPLISNLYL